MHYLFLHYMITHMLKVWRTITSFSCITFIPISCTFVQSLILSFQLDVQMTKGRKIRLAEPAFISRQDHKGRITCCEGLLARRKIKKETHFHYL